MDETLARKILWDIIVGDGLGSLSPYISCRKEGDEVSLDGDFTEQELEAIVWWMKDKRLKK